MKTSRFASMRIFVLFACLLPCCAYVFPDFFLQSAKMPNKSPTSLLHAVKKSYGKNRIQFKEVPETLFFTKRQMNKFSDVEADENGVVHPILGRRQCDINGEVLWQGEDLCDIMCPDTHTYLLAKGTPIPDNLALLIDKRLNEVLYFLAPSASCPAEEYEKALVEFVTQKENICFILHESSAMCFTQSYS